MKHNVLIFAAALACLTACSDGLTDDRVVTAQTGADSRTPVNFSAYTNRGTTRAGATGVLDNAALKDAATDLGKAGFGVFAYYTNAEDYTSDRHPNFLFNKQVKWDATHYVFDYEPVAYWPNEHGSTAQSEDIDKLSFFAYAPYVDVDPSTGYLADTGEGNEKTTWGITGTTRYTYTGDPLVRYVGSFDMDKSVDLCWGVYDESAGWNIMNGSQSIDRGKPWLNVQRAGSVDQRLRFNFRHATARLNVQVDADVDDDVALGTHYGTTGAVTDDKTKIYVRSVTFTGIASEGALNLNNAKAYEPLWMNYGGTGWIENGQRVTVHDGLRDGYEGMASAASNNETVTGLNPVVISNEGNTSAGVTKTAVNLFGRSSGETALTDGVYVIPTGEKVKVTIVYDVETEDNLPDYLSDGTTHGTSIENKITTEITVGGAPLVFEAGKSYTLKLHLGMNSVKFYADVEYSWDNLVYPWVISLDKTSLNMTVGDADETLTATYRPANVADPVTWTTSNPAVATVDENGKVHAVDVGEATITAKSSLGAIATCNVNVSITLSFLKTWVNDGHASDNDKTYLGLYVKSDGSVTVDKDHAIGTVAYYDNAAVDESMPDSRILVLANRIASKCYWSVSYGDVGSDYNSRTALNGIAFTNAYGGDNSGYPAAKAAKNFSEGKPTGASIWFLPSYRQFEKIRFDGHLEYLYEGYYPGYWTSTQIDRYYAYYWRSSSNGFVATSKNESINVRAVFAY